MEAASVHPCELTVIVPVAPGDEQAFRRLRERLQAISPDLTVMGRAEGSRARSLNASARAARTPLLWFLHADCTVEATHLRHLLAAFARAPASLFFFDLAFGRDGPALMRLNAWGGNARARLLGLPFGDQGLAVSRAIWAQLGGFPEDVAYGEDHVFVWRAHLAGIPVRRIPVPLVTSARGYRERGWLRLTAWRQYLWIRQALPFAWSLLGRRLGLVRAGA
ncbi:MAG: glycosyltransferase [Alphaproteobacteria bacterium]|nr:MAG: glycosyltransferase [Alphaproteobacteria bacterium]